MARVKLVGAAKKVAKIKRQIAKAPLKIDAAVNAVRLEVLYNCIEMSNGPYSYSELREMGYPYSRQNPGNDPLGNYSDLSTIPYAMVNYHGGEKNRPGPHIKDCWTVNITRRGRGPDKWFVVSRNNSPHMKMLLGSPRMVDRQLQLEVRKMGKKVMRSKRGLLKKALLAV